MCGTFRNDTKQWPSVVNVFGDALYVAVMASRDIFFPITQAHTRGSFTFMVIQIMKLSIQEILRWEQWTQLPPAACEMGWYSLRQMGEAAIGQQSNHIHLARVPVFPVHEFCSNLSTGWGNLGSLHRGPTVLQTLICTIPEVQFMPAMFPRPLTDLRFLSSLMSDPKSSDTRWESGPGTTCKCTDARMSKPSDYSSWFIQNSQDSPFKMNIFTACADINHAKMDSECRWRVDRSGCMCNMTA